MATPLAATTAPANNDYGGDEISALVLDPGSSSTRAGFAGEDVPKSIIPSFYGSTPDRQHIFGDNSIHLPLPNINIHTPMAADGTVENWEVASKLWQYAIISRLTSPKPRNPFSNGLNDPKDEDKTAMEIDGLDEQENILAEHPLLMSEPGWNPSKSREKSIEIAIEEWGCPAFWLARDGVLAAFAAGKPSALVIDVGAASTSITPVHDGIMLRKGTVRSPLAGDYISSQLRHLFAAAQPPIPLTPHYLVTSKTAVELGAPAVATYRTFAPGTEPHPSFRRLEEERILLEFKESVAQVWTGPGRFLSSTAAGNGVPVPNEEIARAGPGRPFEMPDGFNQVFHADRFRATEGLFDSKAALSEATSDGAGEASQAENGPNGSSTSKAAASNANAVQTLPSAIQHALSQVDTDIKPHLLGNVVVTGGTSLLPGFTDRLNQELLAMYPGPRVRIHAPGNLYERKFSSWIGGSILASLGTFHQMWISRKEYEEQGASIVEKRCK